MPTTKLTHEINCDEETFWKIYLDEKFNERLYKDADGLAFPEWKQVSFNETDSKITRVTAGKPKLDDPVLLDFRDQVTAGWLCGRYCASKR